MGRKGGLDMALLQNNFPSLYSPHPAHYDHGPGLTAELEHQPRYLETHGAAYVLPRQ